MICLYNGFMTFFRILTVIAAFVAYVFVNLVMIWLIEVGTLTPSMVAVFLTIATIVLILGRWKGRINIDSFTFWVWTFPLIFMSIMALVSTV